MHLSFGFYELTSPSAGRKIARPRESMHQEQSDFPKFQIRGNALSKLRGRSESHQSLFSLLLEIESRLRTEGRDDEIEQRKRSKEKDRERSRVNNLSRYCE